MYNENSRKYMNKVATHSFFNNSYFSPSYIRENYEFFGKIE